MYEGVGPWCRWGAILPEQPVHASQSTLCIVLHLWPDSWSFQCAWKCQQGCIWYSGKWEKPLYVSKCVPLGDRVSQAPASGTVLIIDLRAECSHLLIQRGFKSLRGAFLHWLCWMGSKKSQSRIILDDEERECTIGWMSLDLSRTVLSFRFLSERPDDLTGWEE